MNKHTFFLGLTFLELMILLLLVSYFHASVTRSERDILPAKRTLVRQLELTDLSIWTEARYTRHPTQADFFAPFQDSPSAFDHFPAGSILAPERGEGATTIVTQ